MVLVVLRRSVCRKIGLWGLLAFALCLLHDSFFVLAIDQVDLNYLNGRVIVLDPGHGGIDSGASANGAVEKDLNLEIAAKLADILSAQGATVLLTRSTDVDYYTKGRGGKRNDLLARIAMINQAGADLFVSIHLNAIRSSDAAGAQVFYGGKLDESRQIAEHVQLAVQNFPPGNHRQAKEDLDIFVLNATDIPGILVECGYVTNRQEAAKLKLPEYQQKIALQLAKGLAYHFSQKVSR